MLVPALIAVAAVGLGLALGLVPSGAGRVVGPLRTFALTAALAVAATHLLPEAFAMLGGVGLVVFACGLSLPAALRLLRDTAGRGPSQHHDEALEFGYAGLLVHHVADGLGLGAYGGGARPLQLDVLLALAVHTVPLVAVLALAYSRAAGVRVAVLRSAGLALASVLGVLVSASVTAAQAEHFEAWVAAGVAGLLVHVVTHDLERDLPDSTGWRLLDLVAALGGIAVSLAAAAKTAPESLLTGAQHLLDVFLYLAPPLALAFGLSAALDRRLVQTARPAAKLRVSRLLRTLSLERALAIRERPESLSNDVPREAYVELLLASALSLDALLLGAWLAGVRLELLFVLGALVIAALGALLLSREGKPAEQPASGDGSSFFGYFASSVARTSPWLVTAVVLTAMLDTSLPDGALSSEQHVWLPAVLLALLALPAQVDAAAAAPVLAVLVHKGLPAGAAIAGWLALAAPGERGLLALFQARRSAAIARVLAMTAAVASGLGVGISFLGWTFSPLGPRVTSDALGWLCALALAVPIAQSIWFDGLRGWLSTVFLHHHHHHDHA